MPRAVICARCGAENPDSPIITLCKGCGGSLAGAKPASAPAPAPPVAAPSPGRPSAAATPAPARPAARSERPQPVQPPAPEPAEVAFCTNCGTRLEPKVAKCPRCGHRISDKPAVKPGPRPVCPRCGRECAPGRRSCEYCGMHFVGPASGAHVPLPRGEAVKGRTSSQRVACLVLGCIWFGFGLLLALLAIIGAVSR